METVKLRIAQYQKTKDFAANVKIFPVKFLKNILLIMNTVIMAQE